MACGSLAFSVAAVLVAIVWTVSLDAVLASGPAPDTPYTEHVARRWLNTKPKAPVESWGVLPTQGVYAIEAATPAAGRADASTQAASTAGAYFLSPDGVFYLDASARSTEPTAVSRVTVTGSGAGLCVSSGAVHGHGKLQQGSKCQLVVDAATGALSALVSPTGVAFVACGSPTTCATVRSVDADFGLVNSTTASPQALWVGAETGLWLVGTSAALVSAAAGPVQLSSDPVWAVAYGSADGIVAAGNAQKLFLYDAASTSKAAGDVALGRRVAADLLQPFRWEWVTLVATGTGGVVDDMITGMAFDTAGRLYVANPTCLNVRARNGSFSRVSGLQGLPYNNLRAVCVGSGSSKYEQQVWLASDMGVSLWNQFPGAPNVWRYFFGARYHPGVAVVDVASRGAFTYFATDGGVAVIEDQQWTLAQKAAHYETVLLRHNRLVGPPGLVGGLVASCSLASFGNYSSCHNADSDNNGLWTSLVVAAEAFRFAVDDSTDAQAKAIHFFNGMRFLNLVTGVKGLMARSVVATGTPHQPGHWHNSTAYPGWTWKGDTSSDEVTGHMFAYPIVNQLVANSTTAGQALALLQSIATYITSHGFTLVDVTGKPTTWGHWDPATLNGNRTWSDERGVNSLQMLSFLSEAFHSSSDGGAAFSAAYAELCKATNQYGENLLNLKIEAPCDDNYSDDELTFLPYYTLFKHGALSSVPPFDNIAQVYASLNRTFDFVQPWRSDLWNAITMAVTGDLDLGDGDVMASMLWNLRSWPLELVNWPVHNSNRTDIQFLPGPNRSFQTHTDSVRVLPANERNQYVWNADVHDLDGGNGMQEADPGAWLLPYWLARYHGLISEASPTA